MTGVIILTDECNPKDQSPKMGRMTACVDSAQICDSDHACFDVKLRSQLSSQVRALTNLFHSNEAPVSEASLVQILLSAVLIPVVYPTLNFLDNMPCQSESCFYRLNWIRTVQTSFENTLATIQKNLVDIVRGDSHQPSSPEHHHHVEIPPRYRGLCKLGKFRAVGWRNVSAWGLLGLLALALAVTLASIQTSGGEFWIVIATRNIIRSTSQLVNLLSLVPWTSVRADLQRKLGQSIASILTLIKSRL